MVAQLVSELASLGDLSKAPEDSVGTTDTVRPIIFCSVSPAWYHHDIVGTIEHRSSCCICSRLAMYLCQYAIGMPSS